MLALLESPEYRVWDALDEDRSRTATMLHDGVAQPLAALSRLARGLG
jgi:signal transduction histidine kinase